MINMREKDQSKKAKIIQAVFEIVDRDGLAGLSFGKIAKWAGISSGTPYVYYRDKTDMLSQIYVAAKQQLESGLDEQLAQTDSTKEQLITCLEYFARQYIKYPLQANYIMAIHAAPELITPTARQEGASFTNSLSGLYCRMCKESQAAVVGALLLGPIMWLLRQAKLNNTQVDDAQIKRVVRISVNGLFEEEKHETSL
ncbi:TetR/AcrR family transcriptional regulator [Limosilactobacillus mucosae]|uniref:TetR/AcrR family transcriptional regulator n=1 Tax=Limosilactobacillus mucosae TaxID=97478 RepID=UPI0022E990CA|nr:TetR/AcrR family transcriptional regulator [Limosilactobacillus mucosae]